MQYSGRHSLFTKHWEVVFSNRHKRVHMSWSYNIGAYIADIVVANTIIVELKSVTRLNEVMEAQLLNYLRLSKLPVGYLINFQNTRLEWRRFVSTRPAAT
jgi:GxxExxY protein